MHIKLASVSTEANGCYLQVLHDKTQVKPSSWIVVHLHLAECHWSNS